MGNEKGKDNLEKKKIIKKHVQLTCFLAINKLTEFEINTCPKIRGDLRSTLLENMLSTSVIYDFLHRLNTLSVFTKKTKI